MHGRGSTSASAASADLFERSPRQNSAAFDFRSIYDGSDDFFDTARRFSPSGRQSVPVGLGRKNYNVNPLVSVGEVYNDTSSGYSTSSGTSVAPTSSATIWTRTGNGNDFEFVPIREEEVTSTDEEIPITNQTNAPAWRQQPRYTTASTVTPTKRTSSLHELLNSFDQFDPEPILQRAVQATQRAARYLGEEPQFQRRPNTALGNPLSSVDRSTNETQPSANYLANNTRRGSAGTTSNPTSRVVDLRDFPSTNRGDPRAFRSRHPNGVTILGEPYQSSESPRPTHRTASFPTPPTAQKQRPADWLSVSVSSPTQSVDTSALDAVLHSPGRGSEPPGHLQRRPQSALPFDDFRSQREDQNDSEDPMSKTTTDWQKRFDNVRERFGDASAALNDVEAALSRFTNFSTDGSTTIPRNGNRGGFLSKSASQNTMDRRNENNERSSILDSAVNRRAAEAPESGSTTATDRYANDERLKARNPIGNFWLETVRNRLDGAGNFQRAFSPRLTAAERLAELHEPLPADDKRDSSSPAPQSLVHEHLAYRRPNAVDNVASRRAQYLNETLRAQTPTGITQTSSIPNVTIGDLNQNGGNQKSTTLPTANSPNFSSLNDTVAELQNGNSSGCGRFPTELRYSTTTNHPDGRTTRSYFGQTAYPSGNGSHTILTTTRSTTSGGVPPQHSPSPDTLSDTSQQSLHFLPHPRPKHNIREQLMNAGVGPSWTFGGPYASAAGRRLLTNGGVGFASAFGSSSSPNFPVPTSGGVASRISALEKRPGAPNLLQLACVLTGGSNSGPTDSAPMSPRSTVYRTKPVIRVDYEDVEPSKSPESSVFRFPTIPNADRKADLGAFSPKWRGDDTNEARPLQRLSLDGHEDVPNIQQPAANASANRTVSKSNSIDGGLSQPQKPLQRNGSPALISETNNKTIAYPQSNVASVVATTPLANGRLHQNAVQPVQSLATSKQPQRSVQPIAQPQKSTAPAASPMTPKTNSQTSTFVPTPTASYGTAKPRVPAALPQVQHPRPTVQSTKQQIAPVRSRDSHLAGRLANCPQFHYPTGRPVARAENESVLNRARQLFTGNGSQLLLDYKDMDKLCQTIGFAVYAKRAVYDACLRLNSMKPEAADTGNTPAPLSFNQFSTYWQLMIAENHDESSRFIFTLAAAATGDRKPRNYLIRDDFVPMLLDLIFTYPGLNFLVNSTQFHAKYCDVIIVRIFWNVNRSWTGRIMAHELRRSNFLSTLHLLETVSDINKITDYFSYEHFYTVFCLFWEIDKDHKLYLTREDMRHHRNGAITDAIIDRIFSGAVMRTTLDKRMSRGKGPCRSQPAETIGFEDFTAFLLAEEDKKHPTSQEYWFRILDLDGDGVISLYEMEYFYREIERKLIQHNFDTLSFQDVACNLFDSISPSTPGYVTLRELKKCGLAHRFFNTFVNYLKYLEQESSEGERASIKTSGDKELSDWDQFCAMEYEILMAENDAESYADEIDVCLDDGEVEANEAEDRDLVGQLLAANRKNVA
ncbi:hypothetical protein M3Y94_00749800 [Aphelenchoides besseyi]|nr:hypothetical protein M3Y94_00749800 [Aphelenchoides besseyi]KAI6232060.1 EF hand family protein [Aphelenchoides besseyi]